MSTLVAIIYPGSDRALEVRGALAPLGTGQLSDVVDVTIVTRDAKGQMRLDQKAALVPQGAANGLLWPLLSDLPLFAPLSSKSANSPNDPVEKDADEAEELAIDNDDDDDDDLDFADDLHPSTEDDPPRAAGDGTIVTEVDFGITDVFVNSLKAQFQPNTSLLLLLVNGGDFENVQTILNPYGGTLIQSGLASNVVEKIKRALNREPVAA